VRTPPSPGKGQPRSCSQTAIWSNAGQIRRSNRVMVKPVKTEKLLSLRFRVAAVPRGGVGRDLIEKGFQFKTFLAMKFTTQYDLY